MQGIYYRKKTSRGSSELVEKDNEAEPKKEKSGSVETQVQNNNASTNKRLQELLKFDENSLLQGIILSEVLGRPKSRRNGRNRRNYNTNSEE